MQLQGYVEEVRKDIIADRKEAKLAAAEEKRKLQRENRQKERETQTVERRGGERCALVTVSAGKGGEEVHANDGYAPGSKSGGVCTACGAHQGNRILVHL